MLDIAVFAYGLMVCFVLSSMKRNQLSARPHSQTVVLFGWGLMSFSLMMGVLLSALAVKDIATVNHLIA